MRSVVVVHAAIVAGCNADDVQHVVVVVFRVDAVLHERQIVGAVGCGKRFGMRHRAAVALGAKLLGVVKGVAVRGVHSAHHRLVYGGKHAVALALGSLAALLQMALHSRDGIS